MKAPPVACTDAPPQADAQRRAFLGGSAAAAASLLQLPGCAHRVISGEPASTPDASSPHETEVPISGSAWARQSGVRHAGTQSVVPETPASHWFHFPLPGKRQTRYRPESNGGRDALAVLADSSASMVRRRIWVPAAQLGECHFSWRVPDLLAGADMGHVDLDDAPVRVGLVFDGDRSRFSARNLMMSELSLALTGEPMPYAILMYVWSKHRPVGQVLNNPRTDRIRKLVVESGGARQGQWIDYMRPIRTDFRAAFGEDPGPLIGISLMSDTDNTRSRAAPWYGPVQVTTSMPGP